MNAYAILVFCLFVLSGIHAETKITDDAITVELPKALQQQHRRRKVKQIRPHWASPPDGDGFRATTFSDDGSYWNNNQQIVAQSYAANGGSPPWNYGPQRPEQGGLVGGQNAQNPSGYYPSSGGQGQGPGSQYPSIGTGSGGSGFPGAGYPGVPQQPQTGQGQQPTYPQGPTTGPSQPGYPQRPQPGYPQRPLPGQSGQPAQPGYPQRPLPGQPGQPPQPGYPQRPLPGQSGYPQRPQPVQPSPSGYPQGPQPVQPAPPSYPQRPVGSQTGSRPSPPVSQPSYPQRPPDNQIYPGSPFYPQIQPGLPGPPEGELQKYCRAPRGQFGIETSCKKYVNCWDDIAIEQECPGNLVFSEEKKYCDFPENVNCGSRPDIREPAQQVENCTSDFSTYRSSTNCGEFFVCAYSIPHRFVCPGGLAYNTDLGICDYEYRVECNGVPVLQVEESSEVPDYGQNGYENNSNENYYGSFGGSSGSKPYGRTKVSDEEERESIGSKEETS